MSEASVPQGEIVRWLWARFSERLQQALEGMTGLSAPVAPLGGDGADGPREDLLWRSQSYSLGEDANLWVGASRADCLDVGRRALSAAGIDDSGEADQLGTHREILQQAAAGLAQDLSARLGSEVTCLEAGEDAPAPGVALLAAAIQWGPEESSRFHIGFGTGLTRAMESGSSGDRAPGGGGNAAAGGAGPCAAEAAGGEARPFDLLLDVELPVSISFGRAHLPLKEVLKLTSGSIVELNRTVTEPVEVIVNNCVIARGEVVVLEGNYGVRIVEIISRKERLRTLH